MLPWPHLVQKFAFEAASAPQFEQNIWELDAAMLDLTPKTFACTISVQDPRIQHLSLVFGFCREFFVLPWAFWFCRELFGFAVSFLVLPWAIWFCRDTFGFAVRYLLLPWQLWATVSSSLSRLTSLSLESTPLVWMSSTHWVSPSVSLKAAFSLSWDTSALTFRPNGSLSHLHFPHGVSILSFQS